MGTQAQLGLEGGKLLEQLVEKNSTRFPDPVLPLVVLRKIQKDPLGASADAGETEISIRAPPIFSVDDVCEILGIARVTFYAEVNAKRLKVRKIGKRSIITGADFIEYLMNLPLYVPQRDGSEGENA